MRDNILFTRFTPLPPDISTWKSNFKAHCESKNLHVEISSSPAIVSFRFTIALTAMEKEKKNILSCFSSSPLSRM